MNSTSSLADRKPPPMNTNGIRNAPLMELAGASPLYPHMERMSLQAASSSDFNLDDPTPINPAHTTDGILLPHVPIPKTSSALNLELPEDARHLSPGKLLFQPNEVSPVCSSKSSQLKFTSSQRASPPTSEEADTQSPVPGILVTEESKIQEDLDVLIHDGSGNGSERGKTQSVHNNGNDDGDKMDEDEEGDDLDLEKMDEGGEPLSSSLAGQKGTADEKRFPCPEADCSASFVQLAHLKIHLRRHTGERPFVCTFCNKSFNQKGNLKTHERKHTGDKPFKCSHPGCTKEFSQQGNLKTHEKIHLNVKRFNCEQCGKSFSQFGNLKSHIQKVHEKPQSIRRPRANSNTSVSKPPKARGNSNSRSGRGSINAASISISTAAGGPWSASVGNGGAMFLERYYTPSLASRPRSYNGESHLSSSLATPPASDWSFFDRGANYLGFGESDDDEEEEEEEEEDDEDEFDNFRYQEESFILENISGSVDEDARLLLAMSAAYGNSLNNAHSTPVSSSLANTVPLSPLLRGTGSGNGVVKKRKGRNIQAATAATQAGRRSRNASKSDHGYLEDGLQFIIDEVELQEQKETTSVMFNEEEAARLLTLVSSDHNSQVNMCMLPSGEQHGLLPLLASAAASPELANAGGSDVKVASFSQSSYHKQQQFGSIGVLGGGAAAGRGLGLSSSLSRNFERNVMSQFVDAVAKRSSAK